MTRTHRNTVTFTRPFRIGGIDWLQPPGTYPIETDEELIEDLSFTAYRRTAMFIILPGQAGSGILTQTVKIEPAELEAAKARDAQP